MIWLFQGGGGSAVCLIQPFLDNQVEKNNRSDKVEGKEESMIFQF